MDRDKIYNVGITSHDFVTTWGGYECSNKSDVVNAIISKMENAGITGISRIDMGDYPAILLPNPAPDLIPEPEYSFALRSSDTADDDAQSTFSLGLCIVKNSDYTDYIGNVVPGGSSLRSDNNSYYSFRNSITITSNLYYSILTIDTHIPYSMLIGIGAGYANQKSVKTASPNVIATILKSRNDNNYHFAIMNLDGNANEPAVIYVEDNGQFRTVYSGKYPAISPMMEYDVTDSLIKIYKPDFGIYYSDDFYIIGNENSTLRQWSLLDNNNYSTQGGIFRDGIVLNNEHYAVQMCAITDDISTKKIHYCYKK